MDVDGGKGVFHRLGPAAATASSSNTDRQQKVCYHWRAGKCNRHPCPFLHRELPPPPPHSMGNGMASSKRPHGFAADDQYGGGMRRNPNFNNTWGRQRQEQGYVNRGIVKKTEKVCNYWLQGNCTFGEKCRYLHSWFTGDCFSMLSQLEGHQKVSIILFILK